MRLLGFGIFMTALMKTIMKVLQVISLILLNLIVYFGLWIPLIYMIISGILMLTGGLDLTVMNSNTVIFYCGLSLCFVGSIIITIRHLIVTPIKEMMDVSEARRKIKDKADLEREKKLYHSDPGKYFIKYEGQMPHDSHPMYYQTKKERIKNPPPMIYRSNVDAKIIVHEYANHFEIFRDNHGKYERIDIREKPNEDPNKKHSKAKKKQHKQHNKQQYDNNPHN